MKALADAEAKRLKPDILKVKRKDPEWSAPSMAIALNKAGLKTWKEKPFKATHIRRHMQRLGIWF